MTNFERIKQMSAKEFAEWLVAEEDKSPAIWCKGRYCDYVEGDCVICLTEWLNDEVKK